MMEVWMPPKAVCEIPAISFLIFLLERSMQVFETSSEGFVGEPPGPNFNWEVFYFPTYFLAFMYEFSIFVMTSSKMSLKLKNMIFVFLDIFY